MRYVAAGDSKTPRREAHGAATPALIGAERYSSVHLRGMSGAGISRPQPEPSAVTGDGIQRSSAISEYRLSAQIQKRIASDRPGQTAAACTWRRSGTCPPAASARTSPPAAASARTACRARLVAHGLSAVKSDFCHTSIARPEGEPQRCDIVAVTTVTMSHRCGYQDDSEARLAPHGTGIGRRKWR